MTCGIHPLTGVLRPVKLTFVTYLFKPPQRPFKLTPKMSEAISYDGDGKFEPCRYNDCDSPENLKTFVL